MQIVSGVPQDHKNQKITLWGRGYIFSPAGPWTKIFHQRNLQYDRIFNRLHFYNVRVSTFPSGCLDIPMGTHCSPLLEDLLPYCSESEFLDRLIHSGQKEHADSFNFSYR